MSEPINSAVIYIAASPEKVWQAITSGDMTQQYFFGRRIQSDWQVGSPWELRMEDGRLDCQGRILEIDPPRLLRLTWHVEWMEEYRLLPETIALYRIDDLTSSELTDRQLISPPVVRLTVEEHHPTPIDPKYYAGGRRGWPIILSGLKSLLETGHPLPKFDMSK